MRTLRQLVTRIIVWVWNSRTDDDDYTTGYNGYPGY